MSRDVLWMTVNRLSIEVKVSDCWTLNDKPVRLMCVPFEFEAPEGMKFRFARRIIVLWFAIWIVLEEKASA